MKKTILNLYYGNDPPFERRITRTPEYTRISNQVEAQTQAFTQLLSPESTARFNELLDLQNKLWGVQIEEDFVFALCMGARLMRELLTD